jgi:hypothetical protein
MVYLLKMVIFHGYVSLPEGKLTGDHLVGSKKHTLAMDNSP